MIKQDAADHYIHLHRNFEAILVGLGLTTSEFARRAKIGRRVVAYHFNPFKDVAIRGTTIGSMARLAKAAGIPLALFHVTPEMVRFMMGKDYAPDKRLTGLEYRNTALLIKDDLYDYRVPQEAHVMACIIGVALCSRQAALDAVKRQSSLSMI